MNRNLNNQQFGELPASEFTSRFSPSEYSSWGNVHAELDRRRDYTEEMEDSIRSQGIRSPVRVLDDEVVDGHHRVAVAQRVGASIPWEHVNMED